METRATALLTWSVTLGVALVAAAVDPRFRWPAFGALLFALVTAVTSVMALWPRGWFSGGHRPSELDRLDLTTELEFLEHMAAGNEKAADRNEARLRTFAQHIRLCWLSLAAAPNGGGDPGSGRIGSPLMDSTGIAGVAGFGGGVGVLAMLRA